MVDKKEKEAISFPAISRLLLATTNANKVREIRPLMVSLPLEVLTLSDVAPLPEPAETGTTFWENARLKALEYAGGTDLVVVAEDSGLEVDALDGEPGIHSARFLGADTTYAARFAEIYRRLSAVPQRDRSARFVTALAVACGRDILFETESSIDGVVAEQPAGAHGFGYDPIFYYPPLRKTTAQLTLDEKTAVSHRARAFRDLTRWILSKASKEAEASKKDAKGAKGAKRQVRNEAFRNEASGLGAKRQVGTKRQV